MDFNNNKNKSFEELLREKVEHHEFPFEANSWAAMQSKLQAHQAQAAATQTTLYKSILLKTGKILVGVISGSAIVYSTLSLTGMLDKKETAASQHKAQHQIALQENNKPAAGNVNTGNTAMLNITDQQAAINNNAYAEHNANKGTAAQHNAGLQNNSAATAKHFSGKGYMQNGQSKSNNVIASQNQVDANTNVQTAAKNNTNVTAEKSLESTNAQNKLQHNADVKNAKTEAGNTYIAVEKNTSAKANINTEKAVAVQEPAVKEDAALAQTKEAKKELAATKADADSVIALNNANGSKYPQKPSVNKPVSKLSLIVSGGLNNTWLKHREGNSTTLDIIGRPMFGLHASVPVMDRMAVQAGAQYTSYDIKNVSHTSAVVQYAILQDSSVTRTSITQARYMEIPLLVKYAVLPRINVYTGLRTGLLIGAKASVSQEQYVNNRLVSSSAPEDGNKFAQYNGLRSVDFGLPVGVEVVATKWLSVSGTYNMGLTDFTIDNVFDNALNKGQKDKHTSFQLQLNFKPFNF